MALMLVPLLAPVRAQTSDQAAARNEGDILFKVEDIGVGRRLYEARFRGAFGARSQPYEFTAATAQWLEGWIRTLAASSRAKAKHYDQDPRVLRSVGIMSRYTLLKEFSPADAQTIMQAESPGGAITAAPLSASFADYRTTVLSRAKLQMNAAVGRRLVGITLERTLEFGTLQHEWYAAIADQHLYAYLPPGAVTPRQVTVREFLQEYDETVVRRHLCSPAALAAQVKSGIVDEVSYAGLLRAGRDRQPGFLAMRSDALLNSAFLAYADDLAKEAGPISSEEIARVYGERRTGFTRSKRVAMMVLEFTDLDRAAEAYGLLTRRRGDSVMTAINALPPPLAPAARREATIELDPAAEEVLPAGVRDAFMLKPAGWVASPRPSAHGHALYVKMEELEKVPDSLERAAPLIRAQLERERFDAVRQRLLREAVETCPVHFYLELAETEALRGLRERLGKPSTAARKESESVTIMSDPALANSSLALNPPKRVALVFDDGPRPEHAGPLLAVLAKEKVRATFSLIGERVVANPDTARVMAAAGHEIANHSLRHVRARELDDVALDREVQEAQRIIREAIGHAPRWYWAPYREIDEHVRAAVKRADLELSEPPRAVSPKDWDRRVAGPRFTVWRRRM